MWREPEAEYVSPRACLLPQPRTRLLSSGIEAGFSLPLGILWLKRLSQRHRILGCKSTDQAIPTQGAKPDPGSTGIYPVLRSPAPHIRVDPFGGAQPKASGYEISATHG